MIEKMKVLQIVTTASGKEAMLKAVRDLGVLHLGEKKAADKACTDRFNDLSRMSLLLKDYETGVEQLPTLEDEAFEAMYQKAAAAVEEKKALTARRTAALTEADKIRAWGDFNPAEIKALSEQGIDLHFYRMGKKEYTALQAEESIRPIKLAAVDKMETFATVGALPEEIPAMEFKLPERSLSAMEQEVRDCDAGMEACDAVLKNASAYASSFQDQLLKTQNAEQYSSVSNTVEGEAGLVWLTGYVPEAEVESFKAAAKENGWAYALDDPAEDDEKIPTKVRYTKLTKLMIPVFDILGTVPGYHEFDISFWFLGFFTLFFAMIIGDAGYGVLFLLGAIAATVKLKKTNNAIQLLYVLSIATIVWGALTGTWFGLEGAMHTPLKYLVIPAFANYPEYFGVATSAQQNTIMKFCFIIGAVQLSLGCIMSIRAKLSQKNLSWVADLGWLVAIDALYFVVLYLVIGENINLAPVAAIIGVGFLMVVAFSGMSPSKSFSQGLKAGLGDAFTQFLNTISAFGNIMSYIRLFAVGMASLAIAQSFNEMAAGFKGPLIVIGALIMIIGHVLNIVMGFLSVVVHGVRLNLLEFSGQLGMEWSGIAYNPFKKLDKIQK